MLTIEALNTYGADTQAGLSQCLENEPFYLGLVEMLICDEKFDLLAAAIEERNSEVSLAIAYALKETANSLALDPLVEQMEKMLLCLQLHGDAAVLDKQMGLVMRSLDELKRIQQR